MSSKYNELSGKSSVLTVTPYGMLMDILLHKKVNIYLNSKGQYSLDKIVWTELNREFYKELLDIEEYMDNIIIVEKEEE